MATETKPINLNPVLPSKSKEDALKHLDALLAHAMTFAGKPGYNPYIYEKEVIKPAREAIAKETKGAIETALALKQTDPTIDHTWIPFNRLDLTGIEVSPKPAKANTK